jgi:hypothetical protein
MFNYPVTAAEVRQFMGMSMSEDQLHRELDCLLSEGQVFCRDGMFMLRDLALLPARRRSGNERAEKMLATAHKIGRVLQHFPFVRAVGISGSLSKKYADELADIDFFIITSSNRLWLARTLLHLLKKFSFIVGKQHCFCMNYFIDEDAMLMPEQNIFIATEVVTLIPVAGFGVIDRFWQNNDWAFSYFPNFAVSPSGSAQESVPILKQAFEWLLNNRLGNSCDNLLMRITGHRWMKKELRRKLNMKGEPQSLRVGKHFGRPNPEHFQREILERYATQLKYVDAQLTPVDARVFAWK